jgi:hypothetical protein
MTTLLYPVGHYLGALAPDRAGDPAAAHVRLGVRIVPLTAWQFGVWSAAHGNAGDEPVDRPAGRAGVVAALGAEPERADATIELLLGAGLLAEVDLERDGLGFAAAHRLLALQLGLGNCAEQPTVFATGAPGRPLVQLTAPLYQVWAAAHVAPTLLAAVLATVPDAAPADDVRAAAIEVLAALPALLAPAAACLDVAVPEPAEDAAV